MRHRSCSLFIAILILVLMTGCSHVRLIAEYDEIIDKGVTALQAKTEEHLSFLESYLVKRNIYRDGTPERAELETLLAFEASEDFYRLFLVDVRVLKTRADSYENNELTVAQFEALEKILEAQKEIHARGLENPEDIVDMRQAFTRSFRAILKLEIAKKRGIN